MFTVPVLIVALSGAISLGVGFAAGGLVAVGSVVVAVPLFAAAVRLHVQSRAEAAVVRLPGGALAGVATVLSYKNVGSTIHDEPMLEARLRVSVPGRKPYEATVFDVVNLYAASRLSTNAAFRCAVDPHTPAEVTVRWEQPVTLDGFSDPQNRLGVHTPVRTDASLSAAALLASGLPATAHVVQSNSQGTVAPNGDPIMVFVLHVVPDNGSPPFQSLTAQRVPPQRLPLTVVGTSLRVAYDPDNRTRMVAIDWDAPPPAAAAGADAAGTTSGTAAPDRGDAVGTAVGTAPATVIAAEEAAATGAAPYVVTQQPG